MTAAEHLSRKRHRDLAHLYQRAAFRGRRAGMARAYRAAALAADVHHTRRAIIARRHGGEAVAAISRAWWRHEIETQRAAWAIEPSGDNTAPRIARAWARAARPAPFVVVADFEIEVAA